MAAYEAGRCWGGPGRPAPTVSSGPPAHAGGWAWGLGHEHPRGRRMRTGLEWTLALICMALVSAAIAGCGSGPARTAPPEPTSTVTAAAVPTAAATSTPTSAEASVPTAAAPSPSSGPETALAFDPSVIRGTLGNGLAYYVRHNGEPRGRAQLALVVKAGSVLEEDDQRGLAHFVEHMAFNGTARFARQQIIEYLESIGSALGADLNALTGYDHTMYWLEVPADDPDAMETAFRILSDWAYAVTFAPDEVELERGVVLEEWRLGRGFGSRLQDRLFPLLFGDSRYAERSPIGLPEVIEAASAERLRDFYERWYRPGLMAVIAVGDFDAEAVETKVRRHFAPRPEGEAPGGAAAGPAAEPPRFSVPDHGPPRVGVLTDPEAPGTQVNLLRKVPPDAGEGLAAFRRTAVERLAFEMLNARLFERGRAADPPFLWAGGGREPLIAPLDVVSFSAQVDADGAGPGLAALLEELQRVRRHGFTEAEMDRGKASLLSSAESAYRQREQLPSFALVQTYVRHFLWGGPVPGPEAEWELYREVLPRISLPETDDIAASWSLPGNTVLLVVRPERDGAPPDGELAAALRAQLEGADSLDVEPYVDAFEDVPLLPAPPEPGSIVAEERIESVDAVRWRLSNGITVIAKRTDFRGDEVVFGAHSPGGHSLVPDADHVSATHAAQLVAGSGAGPHDAVALSKLLAGREVWVSPYIGELFEGFSGHGSPEDMEAMFQLITLYATAPRLDPVHFSTYVAGLRSFAEARASQPDAVLFDAETAIMSQDHFRRRPLTPALLKELSAERAEAVYADRFADLGDATFVFVGAFDWDDLRSLTAAYLAGLPASGRVERWRDVGVDPPAGREDHVVRSGTEPRSATLLVFAGEMEWGRTEALTLNAMGSMLAVRLRERLREELGGTYNVGASARAGPLPDPEYRVYITFGSDPSRAEELFNEVEAELDWLRGGGEQGYLDTVRELMRTARREMLRDNGFWLREIQTALQRGEPLAEIAGLDDRLDELTLEQVAAAARRYLPDDRYVRIVLLPEDG